MKADAAQQRKNVDAGGDASIRSSTSAVAHVSRNVFTIVVMRKRVIVSRILSVITMVGASMFDSSPKVGRTISDRHNMKTTELAIESSINV